MCDLLAGRGMGSLRLGDDADDEVAQPDATPMLQMSPTSFLPSWSQTQSKADDNSESARQWAAFLRTTRAKQRSQMTRTFLRRDLLGSSEWSRNGMNSQVPRPAHSVAVRVTRSPRRWRSSRSSSRQTCSSASLKCTNDLVQRMLDERIP